MNVMEQICALIAFEYFCFYVFIMDILVSSTADTVSNIDTDADVTAFDTDLPAAHNVSTFCFTHKYTTQHHSLVN